MCGVTQVQFRERFITLYLGDYGCSISTHPIEENPLLKSFKYLQGVDFLTDEAIEVNKENKAKIKEFLRAVRKEELVNLIIGFVDNGAEG